MSEPAVHRHPRRHAKAPERAKLPGAAVFAAAASAVDAIARQGCSSEIALASAREHSDRAAVRAVTLGSVRWYLRLQAALAPLLARPPASLQPPLFALLVTAAHQIVYSRTPAQVCVNVAVEATRVLGAARAAGLVNAVLRRFVKERDEILGAVDRDLATRHAHPPWFASELQRDWASQVEAILEGNNQHPPMTLRVDAARGSTAEYLGALDAAHIEAKAVAWRDNAIELMQPIAVRRLPGFEDGLVTVQDAAAQLAAVLVDAREDMRVLDACAAPGGKTGQLLELAPRLRLIAADVDAERLHLLRDTLRRIGRSCQVECEDLTQPSPALRQRRFERILLDAPCSATGVIRRHPDIKLLRRASDLQALAATQLAMLRQALDLLAPGGEILYCTCSVLAVENDRCIEALLAADPRVQVLPIEHGSGLPPDAAYTRHGLQLLPTAAAGCDGFYFARLGLGR
ncbi:MAG: 16S rRNA (cytosine(967)-C(5))-methyltransferase RsmB [Steroidobacteraceae bacterium]